MQLMVQSKNDLNSFNGIRMAQVEDDSHIKINDESRIRNIEGEIMSVGEAEIVSIEDYYGNEISKIRPDDIHRLKDGILYVYCDSAMRVCNRVVLDIDKRSIEINGRIVECFSSEAV